MKKLFHLTEEGVTELKAELARLIAARSTVAEAIKTAREFGDLSENAEYQVARQEQEKNESRISEIEHIVSNVEIISPTSGGNKVRLGSKVTLEGTGPKGKVAKEADPLEGKISDESPIGKALMGKKLGEEVEIVTPAETTTYKIATIG